MVVENWKWAWTTDVEDDRERAIAVLEERSRGVEAWGRYGLLASSLRYCKVHKMLLIAIKSMIGHERNISLWGLGCPGATNK